MKASQRVHRSTGFITALATLIVSVLSVPGPSNWNVAGQEQVERKNKAPISPNTPAFKPAHFTEIKLDNGLTVVMLEDHRSPVVSAQLEIAGAGPIYDPPSQVGVANLAAQLLLAGTLTRTGNQISEESHRLGTYINTGANFGSTFAHLTAGGLSDNFEQWFSMFTDVLRNPSYPLEAVNKQKQANLNPPIFQLSMASRQLKQATFGNHPGGVLVASRNFLTEANPTVLANWQRERYVPQNAILGIAGDINPNTLIPVVKRLLGDWQRTTFAPTPPANPARLTGKRIMLVDEVNEWSDETVVMVGNPAVDYRNPDYIPLLVMNQILGVGYHSRLYTRLQNYLGPNDVGFPKASSLVNAPDYQGDWSAVSTFRNNALETGLPAFLQEISRIAIEKVTPVELEAAKKALLVYFAIALEDSGAVMNNEIFRRRLNLPADYWNTYATKITAINQDDIQRVTRKYVNPVALQIAGAGDAEQVREIFKRLGTVEIFSGRNALKGCAPAISGTNDFASILSSFVSFMDGPGTGEKWIPSTCVPDAIQCSISEGSLTTCKMFRSQNSTEAEQAYQALTQKIAPGIPTSWQSQASPVTPGILRDLKFRNATGKLMLTVDLRVGSEKVPRSEVDREIEFYQVSLRFGRK